MFRIFFGKLDMYSTIVWFCFLFSTQLTVTTSSILKKCTEQKNITVCTFDFLNSDSDFLKIPPITQYLTLKCWQRNLSELKKKSFGHLQHVKKLEILNCNLKNLNNQSFEELPLLETLRITDEYYIGNKELKISGLSRKCALNLKEVEMVYKNIKKIPKALFCPFIKLEALNLANNYLKNFDKIGCGQNNWCCPNLLSLDLSLNMIKVLPITALTHFKQLRVLNLDANPLVKTLENLGVFAFMHHLHMLVISSNRREHCLNSRFINSTYNMNFNFSMSKVSSQALFHNLRVLVHDIREDNYSRFLEPFTSSQRLKEMHLKLYEPIATEKNIFRSMLQLRKLTIDGPSSTLFHSTKELTSLQYLQFSNNTDFLKIVKSIRMPELRGVSWRCNNISTLTLDMFPNNQLEVIDLTSNAISSLRYQSQRNLLNSIIFTPFSHLKSLYLQDNKIEEFDFSLIPSTLLVLELSDNPITKLTDDNLILLNLSLEVLILKRTLIRTLEHSVFPTTLKFIDLERTSVTHLRSNTFAKMRKLTTLNLLAVRIIHIDRFVFPATNFPLDHSALEINIAGIDDNFCLSLQSMDTCIDNVITEGINKLELIPMTKNKNKTSYCLSISHCANTNCIEDRSYGDASLTVDCGSLDLDRVPDNLSNESVEIYLDGNNISDVHLSHLITPMDHLEKLFLNNSRVKTICNYPRTNTRLKELHANDNELTSFSMDLFQFIELKSLYLQKNNLKYFYVNALQLEEIHLEHNKLEYFPNNLQKAKVLKIAFFNDNLISRIWDICDFRSLNTIHLENNQIWDAVFSNRFQGQLMKRLYLQFNKISFLEQDHFQCFMKLEKLRLDSNRIFSIKKLVFRGIYDLKELYLQNNNISEIDDESFAYLTQLETLLLGGNKIKRVTDPLFKNNGALKILDLSGNEINFLSRDSFKNVQNLVKLMLNKNEIESIVGDIFNNLPNLLYLNLANNQLINLNKHLFSGLHKLNSLYLDNNALYQIDQNAFSALKSISVLTLDNNFLKQPKFWEYRLPFQRFTVSMRNNTYICNCEYIKSFFAWTLENNVSDLTELKCHNPKQTYSFNEYNNAFCKDVVDMIAAVTLPVVVTVCFLMLVVILVYRYRTEMQVLLYSRYGIRFFYDRSKDEGKFFDAFVGYSGYDEEFVAQELLPRLKGYRLCIHQRDFLGGASISDAIVEAIDNSCCTLIVLSPSFLHSAWCQLEFQTAHQKTLQDQCRRLIVVIYKDVDRKELTPTFQAYLRTNTYLRYNDKSFWQKLNFALPSKQKYMHSNINL